jgi:hypothetical protein
MELRLWCYKMMIMVSESNGYNVSLSMLAFRGYMLRRGSRQSVLVEQLCERVTVLDDEVAFTSKPFSRNAGSHTASAPNQTYKTRWISKPCSNSVTTVLRLRV